MVAEAVRHDIGPYLLWVVDQSGTSLPAEMDEQLRQLYRLAVTRSMVLHRAQQDIARALDTAGIAHIWLKGIVLAATVYPDPALRPMVDLDVLVRPEQVTAALECLCAIGFLGAEHPSSLYQAALDLPNKSHHHVLMGGAGKGVILELHFSLLNPQDRAFHSSEQEKWFLQQTTSYSSGLDEFTSLADEAQFLHLCEHMVLHHGLQDFALTRPLDLHLMIAKSPLNWETIITKAVELRWTYVVERALQVAHELFQTPLPEFVLDELRQNRPSDRDVQRVEALARPGALTESMRWTLGSLGWRERMRWVWRVVAPPPRYMRSRYEVPNGRMIRPYYPRRWCHQLGQVIMWLDSSRKLRPQ